jgi:hypothetical protein
VIARTKGDQLIDAYTKLKKMEEFFPKGEKNCPLPSRESHISATTSDGKGFSLITL